VRVEEWTQDHAMRDPAQAGHYRAVLEDERAIRLYERLDFREVARETRHFELLGKHEFVQMERAA
jgi:ribosomal protein S18 acetylase RimI-like enzyme